MLDFFIGAALSAAGLALLLIARPRGGVPTGLTRGMMGSVTPMAFVCLVTFGVVFMVRGIVG